MHISSHFPVINRPGFNDAAYNWETFESNTFFSSFTTNLEDSRYGFDIRLTCQKPISLKAWFIFIRNTEQICCKIFLINQLKNVTISGDECMMWSDIFEEWPKAEIDDYGNRIFEFLPSIVNMNSTNYPLFLDFGSLADITYITWEDNRFRDN